MSEQLKQPELTISAGAVIGWDALDSFGRCNVPTWAKITDYCAHQGIDDTDRIKLICCALLTEHDRSTNALLEYARTNAVLRL